MVNPISTKERKASIFASGIRSLAKIFNPSSPLPAISLSSPGGTSKSLSGSLGSQKSGSFTKSLAKAISASVAAAVSHNSSKKALVVGSQPFKRGTTFFSEGDSQGSPDGLLSSHSSENCGSLDSTIECRTPDSVLSPNYLSARQVRLECGALCSPNGSVGSLKAAHPAAAAAAVAAGLQTQPRRNTTIRTQQTQPGAYERCARVYSMFFSVMY